LLDFPITCQCFCRHDNCASQHESDLEN
jgi:hypothetical protein